MQKFFLQSIPCLLIRGSSSGLLPHYDEGFPHPTKKTHILACLALLRFSRNSEKARSREHGIFQIFDMVSTIRKRTRKLMLGSRGALPSEIIREGLYLGNSSHGSRPDAILQCGITHVVNITQKSYRPSVFREDQASLTSQL